MNLAQLFYFVQAVACGSINRAAQKLFISQSALSQAVTNFEKEIGGSLLRRSRKGVEPTLLGHQLYLEASELIDSFDRAQARWAQACAENRTVSGEAALVIIPAANTFVVEQVMYELRQSYPGVRLVLYESVFNQIAAPYAPLDEAGARLGIGACSAQELPDMQARASRSGWALDVFSHEALQILISARHPLAGRKKLGKAELATLSLVYYSSEGTPAYLAYFDAATSYRLHSKENMLNFVVGSEAAAVFAPTLLKQDYHCRHGLVRFLPIEVDDPDAFPDICCFLIYRPETELTLPERKTLEVIRFHLPGLLGIPTP